VRISDLAVRLLAANGGFGIALSRSCLRP